VSEQILNGTSAQLGYTVPMYSANVIMTKKAMLPIIHKLNHLCYISYKTCCMENLAKLHMNIFYACIAMKLCTSLIVVSTLQALVIVHLPDSKADL